MFIKFLILKESNINFCGKKYPLRSNDPSIYGFSSGGKSSPSIFSKEYKKYMMLLILLLSQRYLPVSMFNEKINNLLLFFNQNNSKK